MNDDLIHTKILEMLLICCIEPCISIYHIVSSFLTASAIPIELLNIITNGSISPQSNDPKSNDLIKRMPNSEPLNLITCVALILKPLYGVPVPQGRASSPICLHREVLPIMVSSRCLSLLTS